MVIIGVPVGLILMQPDFGTCATFFPLVAVAMFFGGIRWRMWAIMAGVVLLLALAGWSIIKPYQKDRILTFLDPARDPLGRGYQVTQAKIAIGSGGIHGKGFRNGTQAKLEFLPARHTDFIFAVLGEEWGFIGVVVVLGLYLYLIGQALTFAKHARDRGGTFLCICLISFFIFHVFINVSMQIGVLPTTGIPLPLISYGGSSTMMFLIAIGLIANVDLRRFGAT
jgi:rod shape determining protein RodA